MFLLIYENCSLVKIQSKFRACQFQIQFFVLDIPRGNFQIRCALLCRTYKEGFELRAQGQSDQCRHNSALGDGLQERDGVRVFFLGIYISIFWYFTSSLKLSFKYSEYGVGSG